MDTKKKILDVALTLFAEKGYGNVYVGHIAEGVGIKAPSLYKHYKSKQDIFDECVKFFYRRMEDAITKNNADNDFTNISTDELIEKVCGMFEFYLDDEELSDFGEDEELVMTVQYNVYNSDFDDITPGSFDFTIPR